MKKGKFIVLEGLNGCGKGTQLPYLADYILGLDKSNTIFLTREPNEFDDNGKKAREMLKSDGDPYSNNIEAVKYFAKNRETHNSIIAPLLLKGIHVISDRYWHSNFAFQHTQGISYEEIAKANQGLLVPDLTLIFNCPIEELSKRLQKRDGENRRKFDSNLEFLARVGTNYVNLQNILPDLINDESILYVDANRSIEEVRKAVVKAFDIVPILSSRKYF
jgi:dTMP kinase